MRSRGAFIGIILGIAAVVAASVSTSAVRVVYNASDSAPRGWYWVVKTPRLRVGDYVVARLPKPIASFAAARGYLPPTVPVLKQIAALAGQRVCVRNAEVAIDGIAVARTLDHDASARPMTAWPHCRPLMNAEIFLLNKDVAASFDSRYFGPIDVSFVRGVARPIHFEGARSSAVLQSLVDAFVWL